MLLPKHNTFVGALLAANAADGCVNVALDVVVHPFASVTVTLYVPDVNDDISCVVNPFDHK